MNLRDRMRQLTKDETEMLKNKFPRYKLRGFKRGTKFVYTLRNW